MVQFCLILVFHLTAVRRVRGAYFAVLGRRSNVTSEEWSVLCTSVVQTPTDVLFHLCRSVLFTYRVIRLQFYFCTCAYKFLVRCRQTYLARII